MTMTRLRIAQNLFEAQRIQSLLARHDIDSEILSYHDTAMDGLYQMQRGYGEVRVEGESLEPAKALLDEELGTATEISDDELSRQALEAPREEPPS